MRHAKYHSNRRHPLVVEALALPSAHPQLRHWLAAKRRARSSDGTERGVHRELRVSQQVDCYRHASIHAFTGNRPAMVFHIVDETVLRHICQHLGEVERALKIMLAKGARARERGPGLTFGHELGLNITAIAGEIC